MRGAHSIMFAVCGLALSISTAQGQQTSGPDPCNPCEIVARRVLGMTGGKDGLEGDPRAAVTMRDRRLLFIDWSPERPVRVADLGPDVLRDIMPVGEGPGEVRYAIDVHRSWNDTLFVFDHMLRRMNVLSPDGKFLRSFRLDVSSLAPDFIQLHDGRFVVAAESATRDGVGLPLHLIDGTGAILKSFGLAERAGRLRTHEDLLRQHRLLALAPDGSFLSVRPGSYVIEHWSANGDQLGMWDVAPDWFAPKDKVMAASHEEPPPPKILGIQVDDDGLVWTLVIRADKGWQEGVAPPKRAPAVMVVTSYLDYVDAQVEVFSLDGAALQRVASVRLDAPLGGFIGPGTATSIEVTDDAGNPLVEFWRVHLRSGTSTP